MKIQVTKKNDKIFFNVSTFGRTRVKRYHILLKDIIEMLNSKEDLTDYSIIESQSDGDLLPSMTEAKYVFEKKYIDIKKKYVKIDQTMESESPVEEQKKEASLPYGLKKTSEVKTKRKKATKKKTEE